MQSGVERVKEVDKFPLNFQWRINLPQVLTRCSLKKPLKRMGLQGLGGRGKGRQLLGEGRG